MGGGLRQRAREGGKYTAYRGDLCLEAVVLAEERVLDVRELSVARLERHELCAQLCECLHVLLLDARDLRKGGVLWVYRIGLGGWLCGGGEPARESVHLSIEELARL